MQNRSKMCFLCKFCLNFTKFQKHVDDKPLDPSWWNFAWKNGRLCAFRQNQPDFLKMNTLCTIKFLLVTLAFESRVLAFFDIFNYFTVNWNSLQRRNHTTKTSKHHNLCLANVELHSWKGCIPTRVSKLTTIFNGLLFVTCCINMKRMGTSRIDWVYITNGERNVQLIQLHNLVFFL